MNFAIACVNVGPERRTEWVNILFDSVFRNLPEEFSAKFVCFTDDPAGLADGITVAHAPDGAAGWYAKLAMFAPDAFMPGTRVIYFDLDTAITGSLADLAAYRGRFAILRDFYRPEGYGSGVMLWEAGAVPDLWNMWELAGRPHVEGGDQAFIERHVLHADWLQDLFPGQIVSYKADCKLGVPNGASVVCFHGRPRPDEVDEEWMHKVWRVGGASISTRTEMNVAFSRVAQNIRSACARDLPWLKSQPAHDGHAVIVGGGPSLADKTSRDELCWRAEQGQAIFATNNTPRWLRDKIGVVPNFHVLLDARPENAGFVFWGSAERYLVFSQCDPAVFDAIRGGDTTLAHIWYGEHIRTLIGPTDKPHTFTTGGSSTGLAAMSAAFTLGYRKMHLIGVDSCYRATAGHAYAQPLNDGEPIIEFEAAGRMFVGAPWMATQAQEFAIFSKVLADHDCEITVSGDGALAHIARAMTGSLDLAA